MSAERVGVSKPRANDQVSASGSTSWAWLAVSAVFLLFANGRPRRFAYPS